VEKTLKVLGEMISITGYDVQYHIVRQTRTLHGRGYCGDTIEVKDTHTALVEFFDVAGA